MKALYPIGLFFNMTGGWFFANHWTHHTPLWWCVPGLLLGTFCLWVHAFKPTFPPFKSMYLLRGTLYSLFMGLSASFAVLWFLCRPEARWSPTFVTLIGLFWGVSILSAPIGGWAYAILTRQEDRIRALNTDDQLKDYERETLIAIRAANPWARHLPTKTLYEAYVGWGRDIFGKHCWPDATPDHIRAFLSWAFTRPIDRY